MCLFISIEIYSYTYIAIVLMTQFTSILFTFRPLLRRFLIENPITKPHETNLSISTPPLPPLNIHPKFRQYPNIPGHHFRL